jgi:xanthine dehydrogenase accessory factor
MDEVLSAVRQWLERREDSALATIVAVERKAPRGPGATMAVGAKGEIVGSLSGGCIEGALVESAGKVIASKHPELVTFGISDDQALGIGLSCGGTLHVLLEPLGANGDDAVFTALARAVENGDAAVLVTALGGSLDTGRKFLVFENEDRTIIGDINLPPGIEAAAREVLARGASERKTIAGADVFIRSFVPAPSLYVIGAVHPAAELCRAAKLVGFRVVVVDPRSPFATKERLPAADAIAQEWPDKYLSKQKLGPRDAVCVLTHDIKFDVPALKTALDAGVGYLGAMGSKKTQARRVERLKEEGVSEEAIARVRSPIGLDIGGDEGGEIAVSIVAEIVAHRHRRLDALRRG